MLNRNVVLRAGICVILLLAVVFCVAGCKKTAPKPKPEPPGKQATQATEPEPAGNQETKPKPQPSSAGDKADMVPIPLELPKPMFVGTPTNIENVTNLEKPLGKDRPPFYAPAGTTNVAAGKSVSGSDEEPVYGELAMITDGDKEATDGSYVDLAPFLQNVTIDLEAEYEIYAIVVWHYHKQSRVYFDVIVQLSNDPDFIESTTVFNNDIDNSAGMGIGGDMHYVETNEGKLIDAKGTRGRYVRLYSNGNNNNDLNHYIEVQVFGKAVK